MTPKTLTYEKAIKRLDEIATMLEEGTVEVDKLTNYLEEAHRLLDFCRQRIDKVQTDVEKILSDPTQ